MKNRFVELFTELAKFFEDNANANPIKTISTLAERIATIEEQRDWENRRASKLERELREFRNRTKTLTCQTDINMEGLIDTSIDAVERMTKDRLARELAEKLVKEMTIIEESFDYFRKVKNVRASITILGERSNEL